MGLSAHQKNGGHDEWLTPPEILRALGEFDLDPCAPVVRPWDTAAMHYTVQDDGLALPWEGRVLLTILEDDIISSCPNDCQKHHPRNAQNAEWSNLFPLSISVPAPADHLAFCHVAGSVWHKTTPNETPSDASEKQDFHLSGKMPTGWIVSELSGVAAHTVDHQTIYTKTTSSHSHTLIAPELLLETWCPHVAHATCQKAQSIRVPGLRTKLLSLGLIEPCGCFVGSYKPRIWLNPPFGREAVKWLRRMRDHGNGVALIPARTETAMFFETVWGTADGVLFLKGRPHFHYVDGKRAPFNSGAPIALVAYGADNLDALQRSRLGFVVVGYNVQLTRSEDREDGKGN